MMPWLVTKWLSLKSGECPIPKKWRWPAVWVLVTVLGVYLLVWA